MVIGFIGTGAIAEAFVTGLYEHGGHEEKILVSERSIARSSRLADRFDEVEVLSDNQAIVDRSQIVVVAVLPVDIESVLRPLKFRRDQTLISLVAETPIELLGELVAPADDIHRAIPMPPIEYGVGPTVLYPSSSNVERLFERVSSVVVPESEADFDVFTAGSSGMASFFDLVGSISDWMQSQGVPEGSSTRYVTALFQALTAMSARVDPSELANLREECQTEGGLNEQVYQGCVAAGWSPILTGELEKILERLRKNVLTTEKL